MLDQSNRWLACAVCGVEFRRVHSRSKYCSEKCNRAADRARRPVDYLIPPKTVATGTVGGVGELLVCVDLMRRGYHVFRSQSSHGPCDLVAFRTGEPCLKIEVKTGGVDRATGAVRYVRPTKHQEYDVLAVASVDGIHYQPLLSE